MALRAISRQAPMPHLAGGIGGSMQDLSIDDESRAQVGTQGEKNQPTYFRSNTAEPEVESGQRPGR